jgi:hypothetical protein
LEGFICAKIKYISEKGEEVRGMKKCLKCGNELLDNAMFCPKCGSKQNGGADSNSQVNGTANSTVNSQVNSTANTQMNGQKISPVNSQIDKLSKKTGKSRNYIIGLVACIIAAIVVISLVTSGLSKRKSYKPLKDDLGDDLFSGTIQIDDTVYEFPCKVSEFLDNGWKSDDHVKTVESHFDKNCTLVKNGRAFSITFENFDDYPIAFEDCYITGFSWDNHQNDKEKEKNLDYPDIFFPGGVGTNTSLDKMADFVETLDEENVLTDYETPSNHLYHYEFEESSEESRINYHIEYQTEKEEIMYTLWFHIYLYDTTDLKGADEADPEISDEVPSEIADYELPDELGDNFTSGQFELDGVVYEIGSPLSNFFDNGWELTYVQGECRTYLEPSEYGKVIITKGDDKIYLNAKNISDKTVAVENCVLDGITSYNFLSKADFALPGDITNESSKEEVEDMMDDLGVEYEKVDSSDWSYYFSKDNIDFYITGDTEAPEEGLSIDINYEERDK